MNTTARTETTALIAAMEHWAKTVAKNGGIAAVTIQEGADRLRELEAELTRLRAKNIKLWNEKKWCEWNVMKAEAECLEQARLLGMSGSREASLLGKISQLERQLDATKAHT